MVWPEMFGSRILIYSKIAPLYFQPNLYTKCLFVSNERVRQACQLGPKRDLKQVAQNAMLLTRVLLNWPILERLSVRAVCFVETAQCSNDVGK